MLWKKDAREKNKTMTNTSSTQPANDTFENPRLLRLGGGILLLLGLVTLVAALAREVISGDMQVVIVALIFLPVGYILLLHARALEKIAALEKQVSALSEK
jgi:hypothetical protein